jgi:adenylate cyclase class IV
MRNLELKFRCENLAAARARAKALGAADHGIRKQVDYFFPAPAGRLKLRDLGDGTGELIAYRRPDSREARGSDYLISRTTEPEMLRDTLAFALGTGGTVRKRRHLFLWKHTRIHLDEVDDLGSFVELETVMQDLSEEAGLAELRQVVAALELRDKDCVPLAYVDLLNNRAPC